MTNYEEMTDEQLEVRGTAAREALATTLAACLAIDRERVRRRSLPPVKGLRCTVCQAPYGQPHEDGCAVVELS
jgi:hypothetical protein